jgi:hypothetical protein
MATGLSRVIAFGVSALAQDNQQGGCLPLLDFRKDHAAKTRDKSCGNSKGMYLRQFYAINGIMAAEEKGEGESESQRLPKPLRWIASSRKDLQRWPK